MAIHTKPVLATNDASRWQLITGGTTAIRIERADFGFVQVQLWVDNKMIDAVYTPSGDLAKWLTEPSKA